MHFPIRFFKLFEGFVVSISVEKAERIPSLKRLEQFNLLKDRFCDHILGHFWKQCYRKMTILLAP